MTKRRDFLRHAATAAVGTAFAGVASRRAHAALSGSYGVQLYTLRNVLPTKPAETMNALHAIGYREVEMLRAGLASWGPAAKDAGLAVPTMHIEAPIVTGDWTAWKSPGSERTRRSRPQKARSDAASWNVTRCEAPAASSTR